MANDFKDANAVRGAVINSAIMVERAIDNCLALFFTSTKEKEEQILNYLLSAEKMLSFDAKRNLLEYILKTFYPTAHREHKPVLREIENYVIPLRNRFAHDHMEYENKSEGQLIGLVKIKNSRDIKWYTESHMEEHWQRNARCVDTLIELIELFETANPRTN